MSSPMRMGGWQRSLVNRPQALQRPLRAPTPPEAAIGGNTSKACLLRVSSKSCAARPPRLDPASILEKGACETLLPLRPLARSGEAGRTEEGKTLDKEAGKSLTSKKGMLSAGVVEPSGRDSLAGLHRRGKAPAAASPPLQRGAHGMASPLRSPGNEAARDLTRCRRELPSSAARC